MIKSYQKNSKECKIGCKNIDLDQKAENDEPTIVILGIIRAFGIIEPH